MHSACACVIVCVGERFVLPPKCVYKHRPCLCVQPDRLVQCMYVCMYVCVCVCVCVCMCVCVFVFVCTYKHTLSLCTARSADSVGANLSAQTSSFAGPLSTLGVFKSARLCDVSCCVLFCDVSDFLCIFSVMRHVRTCNAETAAHIPNEVCCATEVNILPLSPVRCVTSANLNLQLLSSCSVHMLSN